MFKFLIFILVLINISYSNAEENLLTLKQQLDRLQREVNDLSKSVFTSSRDNSFSINQNSETTNDLTAFDLRIYDLEKDIKRLNENFEELIFKIDDLNLLYEDLNLEIATLIIDIKNKTIKDPDIVNNKENLVTEKKNTLGTITISSEDLTIKDENILEKENKVEKKETKLPKLSPELEFQKAFDLLRNQQFDEAKNSLKNFIDNHKNNKLSGSAHYWLGEIHLLKKDYREAALILAEGYQQFPESVKAADMLYKLSESLILIDKKDDACNTLKKFNLEFFDHKLFIKSQNRMKSLNC